MLWYCQKAHSRALQALFAQNLQFFVNMEINHKWSKMFELQVDGSGVTICSNTWVVSGSHRYHDIHDIAQWRAVQMSHCAVSGFSYQSSGTKAVPVAFQTTR